MNKNFKIICLNPIENPDLFWPNIGPLITDRGIIKELGNNIYHEPNKIWFLGFLNNDIIGFCALSATLKTATLKHDFILPDYRGKGFYSVLYDYRLNYLKTDYPDLCIKTTIIKKESIYLAIKNGLELIHTRGKYSIYGGNINT